MNNNIYVAIRKTNGNLMRGATGQVAFDNRGTLNRSLGNAYKHEVREGGFSKASELYDIHLIDVTRAIRNSHNVLIVQPEPWDEEDEGGSGFGVNVHINGEMVEGVDIHWDAMDTLVAALNHVGFDAEEGEPL